MAKKVYRKRGPAKPKQTPEEEILKSLLSIKDLVMARETLPFEVGRYAYMPYNAFTEHQYRGLFNLMMIMIRTLEAVAFAAAAEEVTGEKAEPSGDFSDPRFVTVGKAKEIGAQFRGQRTTPLWAPMLIKGIDEETGEEEVKALRFRIFRVFNVTQFANLDELDIPPLQRSRWGDTPVMERIEAVREHVLVNFKVKPTFRTEPMVMAPHYNQSKHEIVMPPATEYAQPDRFVQSLLHELMHATGAPSELKRFEKHDVDFCSEIRQKYAYEEMVAQFATAFLVTEYGFAHETKRSAQYILSWYKAIEDKPELLGAAMREAMALIKHVFNNNPLPDYSVEEEDVMQQAA